MAVVALDAPGIPGDLAELDVGHVRIFHDPFVVVPKAVARLGPRPASKLPLGLRRQAVVPAIFVAEPLAERHRIVPACFDDRVLVRLLESRVPPVELTTFGEVLLDRVPPKALATLF